MFGIKTFLSRISPVQDALKIQTRNTFILKRRMAPPLHRKSGKPAKLRSRHFMYDLVVDTNTVKKPDLKIILTQFVDGVGNVGDVLTMASGAAYQRFLVPGLAVYASPENLEKYKADESKPKIEDKYSSPYVKKTMESLSKLVLQISMNKLQPWILEPWHIRASFRKTGFIVPEHAIEMPPGQIKGPDLSLQEKEFYITVTINNKDKVNVRCRIHHWATGLDRLQRVEYHWTKPMEPLFPQQAEVLEAMPLPKM